MKYTYIKFLFILLILLTACQQASKTVKFSGTSESWSAEVILYQSSGKEKEDILIKYLNKEENEVESFSYKLDAPNWTTSQDDVNLNSEGIFREEGASLNDRETSEDSEIKITIEWEGKIETITLENR